MSDDIEKLLAEVSKSTQSPGATSPVPASKSSAEVAKAGEIVRGGSADPPGRSGGRLAFAVIAALVFGGSAFVVGWLFTPFVLSGTSMGLGAALGSFITALLAGPPRWFSS
jgi:hypothetical protein